MKILNLYAGIGGNRKLWTDCEVTAVELNPTIAAFYQASYPDDTVIVGDAHQYLLDHYSEFDFIWSSVPCQSHSRARFWGHQDNPLYPDMKLYQEILFLQNFFKGEWIVENVKPYYTPLIEPTASIGRHLFWSGRSLAKVTPVDLDINKGTRAEWESALGIYLNGHKFDTRTDQILRNCVHPEVGKQILERLKGIEAEEQYPLWESIQ